jgi:hypothetical protein
MAKSWSDAQAQENRSDVMREHKRTILQIWFVQAIVPGLERPSNSRIDSDLWRPEEEEQASLPEPAKLALF